MSRTLTTLAAMAVLSIGSTAWAQDDPYYEPEETEEYYVEEPQDWYAPEDPQAEDPLGALTGALNGTTPLGEAAEGNVPAGGCDGPDGRPMGTYCPPGGS